MNVCMNVCMYVYRLLQPCQQDLKFIYVCMYAWSTLSKFSMYVCMYVCMYVLQKYLALLSEAPKSLRTLMEELPESKHTAVLDHMRDLLQKVSLRINVFTCMYVCMYVCINVMMYVCM